MDRKKWGRSSKDGLKKAYTDRGKYPEGSGYKDIFTEGGLKLVWKVEDKSHKVRLLPTYPSDNINAYGLTIHVHNQVGANADKYLCPKRMMKLNCPICEHQAEMWDSDPEMAKGLYPQMRYLVWVVDLSIPKDKQVTKLWSCPKGAMDDILGISYKKSTDEIIDLSHVDTGIAVYFDREKVQGSTFSKYKNFQLDDESMVAKDEWLDVIVPFQDIILIESYDTIKNAFFGTDNVSPETTKETVEKEETRNIEKEPADLSPKDTEVDVENMDRDTLESFANELLSNEYEESEISDMGSKKLKRLVKEILQKSREGELNTKKAEEKVEEELSPIEALKKKLRENIKS